MRYIVLLIGFNSHYSEGSFDADAAVLVCDFVPNRSLLSVCTADRSFCDHAQTHKRAGISAQTRFRQ